jgi:hypothetical protein
MSPQYDTRVCNLDTAHVKRGEHVYVVEDNPRLGLVIVQVAEPLRADQSRRRFYVTRSEWDAMEPVRPNSYGMYGHLTGATPRADA